MKFFLGKSSQHTTVDRSRLYKDFYEFKKTVLHGFPANPKCIAYDNYHKLFAIGTKNGSLQIYGKPGVEFHFQFENETEIVKILFVSKIGGLLCLCSDYSLHLLKISSQPSQVGITKLYSNSHFVNEESENDSTIITTLSLNSAQDLLFIGFKNGDIFLLDIINSFTLKDEIIKQEDILKSVTEELKFKPGPVEVIEEQPGGNGKILIGYSRCLIAFWDYKNKTIENYFLIEQHLEHLSWNKNKQDFVSCHNDGSYNIWSIKQENHDYKNSNSKLPYGPFPCKAIKKIFWGTSCNGEYFIFTGGMPRASYSDKETVSIIHYSSVDPDPNSVKNVVLDFTSKVVDFVPIISGSNDDNSTNLQALVVLAVEEIVVIDLEHPDWLQFKLPYLACLHSSPITCSQYCSNVKADVYKKILQSNESEANVKYSTNDWPINGGVAASSCSYDEEIHHLLITGHEDGTVRFWDATTISLKHLYTVNTSKVFNLNEDDIALIDNEDHELSNDEDLDKWPPFRKVGHFDPYSDDPRLAIRKLSFCPEQGILAVGGTAGQLIVFEFKNKMSEFCVNLTEIKIIDEKDSFIWKGHSSLPVRKSNIKFNLGYQPSCFVQVYPPAAITALTISTCWQIISVGTAHGFSLFEYCKNIPLIVKSTLKSSNLSSVMGGDALISRRKSFKKSLRESFRRLRRSRSQKSKRNIQNKNHNFKIQEANRMTKFDQIETKPIERPIEAKSNEDLMNSMVRYLYFCSSSIISNQPCPTFWVGTNAGTLFIYVLTNDKNSSNAAAQYWQLAKEVQLKHRAPITFIRMVDANGVPLFENHHLAENEKSPSRILICSEEQFKLFSLPNFKTINKFKLTAHEGARVRRIDIGKFFHKTNENISEYSMMCFTNLGDVNIFSSLDFKRKFQHHFIKKEDIHGISSLVFTNTGEGFYLKSSSEYQRFSLSSRRVSFLECFIQIPEYKNVQPDNVTNKDEAFINEEKKEPEETNLDAEVLENVTKKELQQIPTVCNNTTNTETIVTQYVVISDQNKEDSSNKVKNGVSNMVGPNPNGAVSLDGNK